MNPLRIFTQQSFVAVLLILFPIAASFAQGSRAEPLRVVLKGHDPVAYFTAGRPVKGSPQFSYDWDGSRYYFASSKNRDLFVANPDRYAPSYGGYCTGSMARGVRAEADPEAWVISDGRLFVFGDVKFKEIAQKDPKWLALRVADAGKHWSEKH